MLNIKIFSFLIPTILFCGCNTQDSNSSSEKPNIIFILADDLGYNEVRAYGQQKIETPNIDRLAQNGMLFTDHYSGAPVCAPARSVLMTGQHTGHTYIRGNDEWTERGDVWDYEKAAYNPYLEGQRPLPDSIFTLGEMLQGAGYRTGLVGKWGLGGPLTEGRPTKQGFDFFFGYNCQRQAHTYHPLHLWKKEEKVRLQNELVVRGTKIPKGADPDDSASYAMFRQPDYAPELMLEETIGFLESSTSGPFFLYFASPLPHVPLQAPEKWVDYYRRKFGNEEPYLGEQGYFPNQYPRATYAAMISYLDEQVGQIITKLKEMGVYENTLIFFTSDNGPTYAGGVDPGFFESAKPFNYERDHVKGYLHEAGIRVPMLVGWPGVIEPGSKTDRISAFWDILPTLAEITGGTLPEQTDGISFLSTLKGGENNEDHDFLYWEFPGYGGQQAVRIGKWKGIRKNIFEGNMEIKLYNLENDKKEEHDVAEKYPDLVRQMQQIMEQEHQPSSLDNFKMAALGD